MMCTTEHDAIHPGDPGHFRGTRVDVVNNWHKDWPKVLEAIDRLGHRDALMLDEDGWVSARQSVLAAFDGDRVAGHLCFRIEPAAQENLETTKMDAHVDCFGVLDRSKHREIAQQLHRAAEDLAKSLKLRKVHGLEKVS